jgi:Peptidase family M1 domain
VRRPGLFTLLCLLSLTGWPRPSRAEPPAPAATQSYRIEAGLDAEHKRVTGTLKLHFRNSSQAALTSLLFHLYLNAFRDRHSVFMRESGGSLRGVHIKKAGSIEIESLRVDGEELLPDAKHELVPQDFTQLSVPLRRELAPGAQTEIELRFSSQLPSVFARSGYQGDFFAVAQWFPKLAKLEPDGRFAGFPYHGLGEFYADFADYDVTLRVPEAFSVGAVGSLVSEVHAEHTRVLRFRARHVLDMAWFAAPHYVRETRKVGNTELIFLAPVDYPLALVEHENVVTRGLVYYAKHYGAYPYPSLTVVIPPRGAEGAAGMEYPSLIVSAGQWLPTPFAPSLSGAMVAAHELAHQWFYGIVASDEVEHPVLDEGLTEWASLDLMRALYGDIDRPGRGLGVDRFEIARVLVLSYYGSTSPGRRAFDYSAMSYATSVYGRAALVLESIRRAYGKARFEAALALYTRDNRFRHATPAALARAFDASYGAGFSARVLEPLLFAGELSTVQLLQADTQRQHERSRTRVRAVREGKVALPTWLAAYDVRGKELKRIAWPSEQRELAVSFETELPVARVALDPDRALLLDANVRDQIWVFAATPSAPLLPRLIALAQQLLLRVGP